MSEHYLTPAMPVYPSPMLNTPQVGAQRMNDGACSTLISLATLGAVVGASAAAGANISRVQRAEITAVEALRDTGKAALAGAAATAVAGAAANAVATEGATRLAVLFAAGTAVMYGIQRRWGVEDGDGGSR